MKKLFSFIVSLCLCIFGCLAIIACDKPHTHDYTQTVSTESYLKSAATCTQKAVYYKSCSCGEKGTDTFEYGEYEEHVFSEQWTTGYGKHWRVCQAGKCSAIFEESVHNYTDGICVCEEVEGMADVHVSSEQWANAFTFNNVTIKEYGFSDEQKLFFRDHLISGDYVVTIVKKWLPELDSSNKIRSNFDFSRCYEDAEYQDGKYFIPLYDVYGDGSCVYDNAYLTFENGILRSLSATLKENGVRRKCLFEFIDYDRTDIGLAANNLPITSTEWEEVFSLDSFTNVSFVGYEEGVGTINAYWAEGIEKVTVDGIDGLEIYLIDGNWYYYDRISDTYEANNYASHPNAKYSNVDRRLLAFIERLRDIYLLVSYDAESQEYSWTNERGCFTLKIEDGKLTNFVFTSVYEGTTYKHSYFLSNYCATSFTVPFNP